MFPYQPITTPNQIWASLLVEELARCGISHVFIAPGSRSTPLVLAADAQPNIEVHSFIDERALGYAALGAIKSLGKPVAVITTSGTAVANLLPSVIEAYQTNLPLIMLTADRPSLLTHLDVNQTIPQSNLFSRYVVADFYLGPRYSVEEYPLLLTQIDRGVFASQSGPVHFNCHFEEPLYSPGEELDIRAALRSLPKWVSQQVPFISQINEERNALSSDQPFFRFDKGCFCVAGDCPDFLLNQVWQWAVDLSWPVVTDIQSRDAFLDHPNHVSVSSVLEDDCLQTDDAVVIQFGSRFISKKLGDWIRSGTFSFISLDQGPLPVRRSPFFRISEDLFPTIVDCFRPASSLWLSELKAKSFSTELISPEKSYVESVQILSRHPWIVGNSRLIREFDTHRVLGAATRVIANRGASGIDGVLATAIGMAIASQERLGVMLGDIASLYEMNSLYWAISQKLRLTMVVFNNGGGGIFETLPISKHPTVFKSYFKYEHAQSFSFVSEFGDVRYFLVKTKQEFESILAQDFDDLPVVIEINPEL